MGITVRPATSGDINWLLPQLVEFSKFYGTKKSLMGDDPKTNRRILLGFMDNHPFFIAHDSVNGPIGFVFGFLVPHVFNPKVKVLQEAFWWVDPDHRGSSAAARLLNAFIDYGKTHADMIFFSLIHDKTKIDATKLIVRGFRPIENVYLMEVE